MASSNVRLGPPKIILADDHPVSAIGTEAVIHNRGIGTVVGRATDSDSLVRLLHSVSCDVLVTDFSMPGQRCGGGMELITFVQRHFSHIPVVVLTMMHIPGILEAIWRSGVAGLVGKDSGVTDLALSVQAALFGERYMAQSVRERIGLDGLIRVDRSVALSPRESEVLRLLASGLTVVEIAEQQNRSFKTISRQKMTGMAKLGVSNDAELFHYLSACGALH
ncbi:DNA-binding response regulator [Burkholderia sp. Nafp2/4-1b]|uniref:response regulator n=1 Tax=Burkholderia sp. Nafp2/4-1b TaxID=2116686 RepID=UPI000EF93ED4|nr:response regulator [Burkholderia sp. Nafp2/4-1b]RKT98660.1 DNA-binding response regulator [Burkholderia sp. Nafp2/4-1b]